MGLRTAFLMEAGNLRILGGVGMAEGLGVNGLGVCPAPGASASENAQCHKCPFGLMKWGFLFLSALVALPIADGVQARQKGTPFFPV